MNQARVPFRQREYVKRAIALVFPALMVFALPLFAEQNPALPGIEVVRKQIGNRTLFSLKNPQLAELTVSLRFGLINLVPSTQLPIEVVVPPQTTTAPLVVLYPVDPDLPCRYTWEQAFTWGSPQARHNTNYAYRLPYQPGQSFTVVQGHDGSFSHSGENRFALDFSMPEGTPILATRDGLVVLTRDGFGPGGATPDYKYRANEIFVRHEDGTLGEYVHLLQGALRVSTGQKVAAGQVLGLSGNSGYTRGPHLHFMVFRARDSKTRESMPCKFQTAEGAVELVEGHAYTAPKSTANPVAGLRSR